MSERSVKAFALLSALNALDSHISERAELTAAGVNETRIEALYPRSYEGIAGGLLAHLMEHGVAHLPQCNGRMDERIATKSNALFSLPPHLLDQWKQLDKDPRVGENGAKLHAFIREQLGGDYMSYIVADNFNSLLLRSWHLATWREDLPQHLKVNSDLNMLWVGDNLLPQLAPDYHGRLSVSLQHPKDFS